MLERRPMSAPIPSDKSPIACAQRWVMAVPWHAVLRWNAPWDRFGLVPRPARSAEAVHALERHWRIVTTQDVERTLASLSASANARDAAWHLSSAVLVAELAYAAFLMDQARAWQAAVDAARALQRHHRGWFSMAEGYLRGLAVHRPESPDPAARDFLINLHARPDSPWNTLAWNTELPEWIPPPLAREDVAVVHVDSSEGLDAALADNPGARIRLATGVYVGPFTLNAEVLERAEHAPDGSVVLEVDEGPVLTTARGAYLRGLILRGGADAPAVVASGGFLRIEDCRFEGGSLGLEATSVGAPAIVQLQSLVFEGLSDSAVALTNCICVAHDVAIASVGGAGFALDGTRACITDAFIEAADRAGVIAVGGDLTLRKVRIHDAERWGVALSGGARAELVDVEVMRSIVGLRAAEGAIIQAERCRLADAATANIELLDIGGARFVDCHVTGGDWAGVWLHPGTGASFRGGQVGGSRQACMMIEGGRDISLSGVGIGPSHEGGGLFIAAAAEVRADGVFVSGAALAGVELRASRLVANDLRVRGSVEGMLVRDGAHLEGYRLDLAEIRGTGLWLACGSAAIAGLGVRKVGFGVVVGGESKVLVQNFVCAHTSVVAQVEGGRLALAGRLTLGGGAVRVKAGLLAARGLEGTSVTASDAELYLESGSATGAGLIDVQGRSRLVLMKVMLGEDAIVSSGGSEILRDPPPSPITAMSPLSIGLVPERFEYWGVVADAALLMRVVAALVTRFGLGDKVTLRETPSGVRVDGALPAIARLAPSLGVIFDEPGALGVLLADLIGPPRTDVPEPGGPRSLA